MARLNLAQVEKLMDAHKAGLHWAAAPDLLAACEEALRQLSAPDCPCIPDGAMVRGGLYNAILKARGQA